MPGTESWLWKGVMQPKGAQAGLSNDGVEKKASPRLATLRDHLELFDRGRLAHLAEPYPAWTAVEVAGLRRFGALVEVRVIASRVQDD